MFITVFIGRTRIRKIILKAKVLNSELHKVAFAYLGSKKLVLKKAVLFPKYATSYVEKVYTVWLFCTFSIGFSINNSFGKSY